MNETASKAILAGLLSLESAETPMHVGALLRFTSPSNASDTFLQELAAQWRTQAVAEGPWHCRLHRRGVLRRVPHWVPVARVDIDYHFRQVALPSPGGERELGVLISRLHSQALDWQRPLWECYLIEGLEQQGFALYLKLHRALVDALGGMTVAFEFLASHEQEAARAPWSFRLPERPSSPAKNSLSPLPLSRSLWRLLYNREVDRALPYRTPRTALNGPVTNKRRFATQRFARERLDQLASQFDTDPEAILLYLLGSALRRFLKEFNALPEQALVAAVPLRRQALKEFSLTFVSLGTDKAQLWERFEAVRRSYRAALDEIESIPEQQRMAYSLLAGSPMMLANLSGAHKWLPAMFNVMLNNVQGPEQPRYLAASRLESLYSLSLLMPGTALSLSAVYTKDAINIGFTGASETLPHVQNIAVYMGLALDALEQELGL